MKFLVILISLVVTYFWQKDLDQIDDRWFFKLRSKVEAVVARLSGAGNGAWFASFVLTYAVPLFFITFLLWLTSEWLFGLVALVIHVFVLLMAFDRIHPALLSKQFIQLWEQGNYQGCSEFLENQMECDSLPASKEPQLLFEMFSRLYVYRCFEKMFVTLFWYLIAGPLGVLVAYISYQLRDEVLGKSDEAEAGSVNGLILILEWLPLRLLGLTLCLVGNFEACFARLKRAGFRIKVAADETVYEMTKCALGDENTAADKTPGSEEAQATGSEYNLQMADELESLMSLMNRCQYAWLTVIALATVFGWPLLNLWT